MGFTRIGTVSKRWNPHDKGEGIPKVVICDSVFDRSKASSAANAELTIYLKVWFEQHTTAMGKLADGNGVLWDVRNWTAEDNFAGWCQKVKSEADAAWDNKLTLVPPARYDGLDVDFGGDVYRLNVVCRFVLLLGDAKYFHAKVKVGIPLPQPEHEFKVKSRVWNKDKCHFATPRKTVQGPIAQVSCSHEIGHLMGLQHVGRVVKVADCNCVGVSENEACNGPKSCEYGIYDTRPEIAGNIMGAGMDVSEINAQPWQQVMCEHANADERVGLLKPEEWTARTASVPPVLQARARAGCSGPFR
jgi:hypothetical protein